MPTMDLPRFDGLDPAVAPYLSILDLGRGKLNNTIKDLTPEQLEKRPEGFKNTVVTLAVHIAATEVSFAYRIMGQAMPEELLAEFPPHRGGPLPEIKGESAQAIIAKLEKSRAILQEAVAGLSAADLNREIALGPERAATVAWLLGLLPGHLNLHLGHIQMITQHL